jgi:glycosyltransferase involved in cell wall biosynthesis
VGRTIDASDALLYATKEEQSLLEQTHPQAKGRASGIGTVGIDPPSGADPERFRARRDVHSPYLLYGGRWGRLKGQDQLIEAMERLHSSHPQVKLVLTGEAGAGLPPRPWLRRLGRLSEQERWDALAGASAVVIPSALESLSLLALEAWAVARPVIVNAASPVLIGQVKRSGGGAIFHDSEELAVVAANLLDHADTSVALGERGRTYVIDRYRWADVHTRLEGLISAAERRTPR